MSTSISDKPGKKIDNKRYRHYMNQKVRQGEEDIEPPHHKTNPWNWPKDGKQYWSEGRTWNNGEWMRK